MSTVNVIRRILEHAAADETKGGAGGAAGAGAGAGAGAAAGGNGGGAAGAGDGKGGQGGGDGKGTGGAGAGAGGAVTLDLPALRKQLAGGDADVEKLLDRYGAPDAIGKALKEAQARISQGFKPEPFPDKGTPEQQAAWRVANGVAGTTADYIKNVGDGIVIGELDKPIFESFAEVALKANLPQAQFNEFAKWYGGLQEELVAAKQEHDTTHQQEVDDTLIKKFGPGEYRANNANMMQLIEANFPEPMRAALLNARDETGRKILTHPEMREALFQLARTVNPAATLIPNGSGNLQTVEAELAALQKERSTDINAWMKNEKGRARERELLDVQARLKAVAR